MKKMQKNLLISAALLTLSFALPVLAETENPDAKDVVILATSDVHAGIDQHFGYVGLQQIRDTLESGGAHTILIDDGDSIQGEIIGAYDQGETIIGLMNDMGYDLAIPGNHEFDYGVEHFVELSKKADYPYICCNLVHNDELIFDPYTILEAEGLKLAFVGVTTPTTIRTSTPTLFEDETGKFVYNFMADETGERLYNQIQAQVDAAREAGADYVFLMGHLGNEAESSPWTYEDVLTHLSGVDFMFDGHSHDNGQDTVLDKDGKEVPRMGLGTKMNAIGLLRISAADGSLTPTYLTWPATLSAPKAMGLQNRMTESIDSAEAQMDTLFGEVIGKTPFLLTIMDPETINSSMGPVRIIRRAETNLGDLCADALRDYAKTDVAVLNGGSIRTNIEPGEISLKTIYTVFPFLNTIVVAKMSGQQILDTLEWGARVTPEENGGFLQVSGMTYEIHTYIENPCSQDEDAMCTGIEGEHRVKNVTIGGKPMELDQYYTVAVPSYTALNHGDGYTTFDDAEILDSGTKEIAERLIELVRDDFGGVIPDQYADPYGEGRIIAVDEPVEEEAAAQ